MPKKQTAIKKAARRPPEEPNIFKLVALYDYFPDTEDEGCAFSVFEEIKVTAAEYEEALSAVAIERGIGRAKLRSGK